MGDRFSFDIRAKTERNNSPKNLVIFSRISARGAAPGAVFFLLVLSFQSRFSGFYFALPRAAGDAGSGKEVRGDDHIDGARHHAVGTAGNVVTDVFAAGERGHGVAIGFIGAKVAGNAWEAFIAGGFVDGDPSFAAALHSRVVKGGIKDEVVAAGGQGSPDGSRNSGYGQGRVRFFVGYGESHVRFSGPAWFVPAGFNYVGASGNDVQEKEPKNVGVSVGWGCEVEGNG